jgi:hypothetical protein
MFGGDGQQLSADAALTEARELAYGVLQASVAETSPDGTANPAHVPALMGIGTWDRQIDSRTRYQALRLWPDHERQRTWAFK